MTKHEGDVAFIIPKIFLYLASDELGGFIAYALAEDGSSLMAETVVSTIYAPQALNNQLARREYDEHYPAGYHLVDLLWMSDEELDTVSDLAAALARNNQATEDQ